MFDYDVHLGSKPTKLEIMEEILLHEEPILGSKPVEMVRPSSSIIIPKKGE